MTATERIRLALERHPDRDDRYISKVSRATLSDVRTVKAGGEAPEREAEAQPATGAAEAAGPIKVISINEVVERYDVAAGIRRELSKLKSGVLVLERDFAAQVAGKDFNRFRRAVDNHLDEFRKNRVKLSLRDDPPDGRYYWGDARTVSIAVQKRDEFGR